MPLNAAQCRSMPLTAMPLTAAHRRSCRSPPLNASRRRTRPLASSALDGGAVEGQVPARERRRPRPAQEAPCLVRARPPAT
eukprot:365658-Prymnesium_polylepis.1